MRIHTSVRDFKAAIELGGELGGQVRCGRHGRVGAAENALPVARILDTQTFERVSQG